MKLLYYALKYNGEYNKIKKAIESNESYQQVDYKGEYITIEDENYPKKLKELPNPPFVLFYRGNLELLNSHLICVVGGREHSAEAKENVKELCKFVKLVYVSGLAKGIDCFVHEFASQSVGIIGCGINRIYPIENKFLYDKVDLLISEYPNDVLPLKHHFPMRNRIMVALSECLVIVEGKLNSGTQISVNLALELGKEVFVFPKSYFNLFSSLNHSLIEDGAHILKDKNDLLELDKYLNNWKIK